MKKNLNNFIFLVIIFITGCSTLHKNEPPLAQSKEVMNPKRQTEGLFLEHKYFTINYNSANRLANWVKYSLKKAELNGPGVLLKKFKPDPILVKMGIKPVVHDDYTNSGYARGHLAPAEDFSRSQDAIESTFVMSNVIPQKGSVNSGSWAQLEKQVRAWACGEELITVITGPVIKQDMPKIHGDISVPQEFFKIVIDETPPKKAIAFVYDQSGKSQSLIRNQVALSSVLVANNIQSDITNDSALKDWKDCK